LDLLNWRSQLEAHKITGLNMLKKYNPKTGDSHIELRDLIERKNNLLQWMPMRPYDEHIALLSSLHNHSSFVTLLSNKASHFEERGVYNLISLYGSRSFKKMIEMLSLKTSLEN
jgi:hypothetical protein